jgi:hypothetical protein
VSARRRSISIACALHPGVHVRLEKPVRVATVAFRTIKRHVGAFEELVRIASVVGRDRNADAGADHHLMPVKLERLGDLGDQARRKRGGAKRLLGSGLHDGEFVAAEPRHKIGRTRRSLQSIADRP